MHIEIKFKSITLKWFLNIFLVIALVICACGTAFSILFNRLYTDRLQSLAGDYVYEFSALSTTTPKTFKDTAISLASDFKFKDKIEVQVVDNKGQTIVSTTGFVENADNSAEYQRAKQSGKTAVYKGKTGDGEPIMAATTVIYGENGEDLGGYRWITSMTAANKIMYGFTAVIILICTAVLCFCVFSGLFFVKSIVRPIRDVSNMARTIAMGNFDARLQVAKNDEIGELCDAINYMASELQQSENIKNDFISSVSHELRTPLTAIRGWGETAKMSLDSDIDLVKRGLDVVLSEADRLSGLVEELLDFSRMQTGRLIMVSAPMNVVQILSESFDMYAELAKKQEIDLVYTKPNDEFIVMGDPNRLKQVFINIIDNAVKYTEKGGQVLVDITKEEGCVRVTVTDTGVGIPAQDIDRVKEKFYKANKTVRGSGIGLAVADEIIKQHSGLLFIESTENVGTTVTVVLPLYQPEETAEPEINEEGQETNG